MAGSFVFTDTLQAQLRHDLRRPATRASTRRCGPSTTATRACRPRSSPRSAPSPACATVEPRVTGTASCWSTRTARSSSRAAHRPRAAPGRRSRSTRCRRSSAATRREARDEVVVNDGAAQQARPAHRRPRQGRGAERAASCTPRISGIYKVSYDTGGYIGVLFTPHEAMRLFTDGRHYSVGRRRRRARRLGARAHRPHRQAAAERPGGEDRRRRCATTTPRASPTRWRSSTTSCSASASSPCWSGRSSSTTRSR